MASDLDVEAPELDTAPPDTAPPDTSAELDTSPEADESGDDVATTDDAGPQGCTPSELQFVDLPEASGAVALDDEHDLLVADSGHSGRALVLHRAQGAATTLTLPLGEGAGDDVEGLSLGPPGPDDRPIWGLSSAGYLRAWRVERSEAGWAATLIHGPVAIGEPGEWVGGPHTVNTGGNFEGLCLHPAPAPGACAGWAASKARGELVCLRSVDGSYRLDPSVRVAVLEAEQPSDCAYEPSPPHRLFVAGNVYSGDRLLQVEVDSGSPPTAERLPDLIGAPNQEAILVRNLSDVLEIQSFGDWQDLAGDRSPRLVFTCRP